jgi:hypothetical protein
LPNVLVFADRNFPGYRPVDIKGEYTVCDAHGLADAMSGDYDAFVNLHGGYFPLNAIASIYRFLESSKGFVNVNDTPFVYPCTYDDATHQWNVGREQTSYYRQLNIHSVLNVRADNIASYAGSDRIDICRPLLRHLPISDTKNFILIPTKNKYEESEWGSVGSMDSRILPLVAGLDQDGEHYSSPVVLIENRAGRFKGGRWVFINQAIGEDADFHTVFEPIVRYIGTGYREILVKPSLPMYYANESVTVKIQIENFVRSSDWNCTLKVIKDHRVVFEKKETIAGNHYISSMNVSFEGKLTEGPYTIELIAISQDGEKQKIAQGFYVFDEALLRQLPRAVCGQDYFVLNGTPTPIIGTTYMSSDYSRSFLQLPNVSLWMNDMADMKRQGINWIRTGVWCNWRNFMLDDAHFAEHILRAIDAFLLCAAANGLYVTFTFFTFIPEAWEGTHPYLDRRSTDAQKRFVSSIVTRHKDTTNVDWDLINEPYTFDHPSQKKSLADTTEDALFREYMAKRFPSAEAMANTLDLNFAEVENFSRLKLPSKHEINFDITDMGDSKNGLIWQDYVKFILEGFNDWAAGLRDVIKSINPEHLVTIGQDEAIASPRPTALLCGDLVDYHCQHTWWLLDDLVWDTVFTKFWSKPLLVQETGIMYAEKPNNQPRRAEDDIAKLLQKKYAYAFGTRCAGAIQWIWNTNYYLRSANESNIGAIRCDGSKKPEMKVTTEFASFFAKLKGRVSDIRHDDEIAVIYPFTNQFSNRQFAHHATTHLTKVLAYELKRPFVGIGEFDLDPLLAIKPKVIIVPSGHHFNNVQFTRLMEIVAEIGSTLIYTGPISLDEYFTSTARAEQWVGATTTVPLSRFEKLEYGNKTYDFSFDHLYVSKAFKDTRNGSNAVTQVPLGNGELIWINVPVELTSDTNQLAELYEVILNRQSIIPKFKVVSKNSKGIFVSKINWEQAALYTIVSEIGEDHELEIFDSASQVTYRLRVEANGSDLFAVTPEGAVIASYRSKEITTR